MLATISGTVFNDLNADGVKNTGESGQSGWTVYLDADGNGQLGTGEAATITATDGSYSFNGLAAGTYTVAEVQQLGWQQTSPVGSVPSIGRVSVADDGTEGNGSSSTSDVSADGRYVTYSSYASNRVPGDTNGVNDIFVYDRQTNTTELVSIASDGTQGNASSLRPSISGDGRHIVFVSYASNLVPGLDSNEEAHLFAYDRVADTIEQVSQGAFGTQGALTISKIQMSTDGQIVAFNSSATNLVPDDTNGVNDIFVYDRLADTIERVNLAADGTQANGHSWIGSISADGRYVAFDSGATNLVTGDTNGTSDIFVYDRQTRTTERVSVTNSGTQANNSSGRPDLSADGRYVAFSSYASNLVNGDTNGVYDIFVYDRQTDTIERVSLASDGTQGNGDYLSSSALSADGRYVAFSSYASNLVPGDTNGQSDIFVYDRQTDAIKRVNVSPDGTQANNSSPYFSFSADGHYVTIDSNATNLVPGDTNGVSDVFVTANPFAPVPGNHVVAVEDGQVVSGNDFGNTSLTTKFYVVNDASLDRTYEYNATGTSVETYGLNTGNTAPRGAASTVAGDKTWVVDANRKVYVYNNSGALLGSWTAGTLSTKAVVEGIATNGTDIWIVDAYSDKVYKYAGGAARLSGTWTASSFSLNSANTSPKDLVTDGVSLWVVNDSTTDKVFKYTTAGKLSSSWTITTPGASSPTGITIDPANVSNIWIVDNGTDRVYQYNAAVNLANGSSKAADVSFALAVGNTNPQGIADPPAPGTYLVNESPAAATVANDVDAALESLYYEPVRQTTLPRHTRPVTTPITPRVALTRTADANYLVGTSANRATIDSRSARDHHRETEIDALFATWDSDPLGQLNISDLEM